MNNIPFQCSECPQNRRIDFCPACECKEFYIKGQRHVFRMAERFRQRKHRARSLELGKETK